MKKAFLQLHIAVFLAGFTGILGRLITVNEGLLVWYRLMITAATMWIIYGLSGKIKKISGTEILKVCGVGVIAALHWVTFYGSIKYSNVSVALVCFSSIGFFTAIFEPLIVRKRINYTELLLGLVTMVGIYVIFHFDSDYKVGIIVGIISAVLAAIFPIYNREFLQRMNAQTMLSWQLSGGFVFLSILLPFYLKQFPTSSILPGITDFLWLLVLSWLCSVIAFQFLSAALKRLSAFTVNITYNLEPVYGIALAFIVYKENQFLSKWFFIGFTIIAAALLVHIWMIWKAERKPANIETQ